MTTRIVGVHHGRWPGKKCHRVVAAVRPGGAPRLRAPCPPRSTVLGQRARSAVRRRALRTAPRSPRRSAPNRSRHRLICCNSGGVPHGANAEEQPRAMASRDNPRRRPAPGSTAQLASPEPPTSHQQVMAERRLQHRRAQGTEQAHGVARPGPCEQPIAEAAVRLALDDEVEPPRRRFPIGHRVGAEAVGSGRRPAARIARPRRPLAVRAPSASASMSWVSGSSRSTRAASVCRPLRCRCARPAAELDKRDAAVGPRGGLAHQELATGLPSGPAVPVPAASLRRLAPSSSRALAGAAGARRTFIRTRRRPDGVPPRGWSRRAALPDVERPGLWFRR